MTALAKDVVDDLRQENARLLAELRAATPLAPLADGMHYVTRLDDCRAVLRDTTAFSNAAGSKGRVWWWLPKIASSARWIRHSTLRCAA